ncbi:hypothetical protein ONS95_013334 [Cadophora gregata]|uniref:uncharacterized protein n=1 Tax=Cadophora gregata TaxID=51156 RepID=UPI0026DDA5E8|nr:uncharacterized protein ONS95_013334 [Cadophora gregata]KAK0099775.1 hypothetical protein ONS96_008271 [Cadophora gregata f. sp. sojae]KAK0116313.1 hypothetical protein ONS95_013334 [Cadophora gregata]
MYELLSCTQKRPSFGNDLSSHQHFHGYPWSATSTKLYVWADLCGWIWDYLNPGLDSYWICGGAQCAYFNNLKSWENNWDDSSLLAKARASYEHLIQDSLRGKETRGAAIEYIWTEVRHSGTYEPRLNTCAQK